MYLIDQSIHIRVELGSLYLKFSYMQENLQRRNLYFETSVIIGADYISTYNGLRLRISALCFILVYLLIRFIQNLYYSYVIYVYLGIKGK